LNEEYCYLGKTTRILRENNLNFISKGYTPLISTNRDSIWVNEWPLPSKTVYTIYSIIPAGYNGFLFDVQSRPGTHFVDLWRHEEIPTSVKTGASRVLVQTDAFNASWLGTNNEGAVDCIAQFPLLLGVRLSGDRLTVHTPAGMEVHIWAGNPSYGKKPLVIRGRKNTLRLSEAFGGYEGKFVIQLFKEGELMDERVYKIAPGTPLLVSKEGITPPAVRPPAGMVRIPAGSFTFHTTHGDDFISYPNFNEDSIYAMRTFYMDKFPVTNQQFKTFIDATNYRPLDTANFLKGWVHGAIPPGEEQFPVVYVSYEDAQAYAKWAGKRLPTEVEWQYGAQTSQANEWPWKQKKPVRWSTQFVTRTLTVKHPEGIDPRYCNPGNGQLYPVGKYKRGTNPYGLEDLVGCVWQLTNDIYQDGSYRYIIMKSGSYFNPSSSWWYVQGGPRPLTYRQFLLRVSRGFERNATVGFRCVKDAPH
ncbi:MAG TPA: formylglycine-generating enzyme family protein, partial [Chitinophagaceae bacterium]